MSSEKDLRVTSVMGEGGAQLLPLMKSALAAGPAPKTDWAKVQQRANAKVLVERLKSHSADITKTLQTMGQTANTAESRRWRAKKTEVEQCVAALTRKFNLAAWTKADEVALRTLEQVRALIQGLDRLRQCTNDRGLADELGRLAAQLVIRWGVSGGDPVPLLSFDARFLADEQARRQEYFSSLQRLAAQIDDPELRAVADGLLDRFRAQWGLAQPAA